MNEAHRMEAVEPADLATLSWCMGEIRESLDACMQRLRACAESGDDGSSALTEARTALHQAHGALSIVDVEGVALVTGEAEQLLGRVAERQLVLDASLLERLAQAFSAVTEYLDELLLGEPQQPLYLFPYYRSLLEVRAAERIHPADLFVVPVSARLVVAGAPVRSRSAEELAAARAAFERGLLGVLRDPVDAAAVSSLHSAVASIGNSQIGAAHPTFWKIALAYFEALRDRALTLDVYGKRLLARLNLQLRRSIADGAPVAERLMKDTLFALARADDSVLPHDSLVREVRRAFRLARSVPPDFESPRFGRVDTRSIVAAKEAIARAKIAWEKLAQGSASELASFAQAIAALHAAVAPLPFDGVRALAEAFRETSRLLALGSPLPSAALALEAASALLFAEQIFDRGLKGQVGYDARAAEMAERLVQTAQGHAPSDELPQWLREISQAAQERLTMATFIVETQANLRTAEQVLDSYFRDPTQRLDLPQTVRQLRQVAGALQLLGHQDASEAAAVAAERVQSFADCDDAPAAAACEALADSVGALGFFVDGLQQAGRAGARFEFDRGSGRFQAVLGEPRPDPGTVVVALDATAESRIVRHAARAGELLEELQHRPHDGTIRSELHRMLERVRDDAQLADDGAARKAAAEAIALLDAGDTPFASIAAAVARLSGASAPVAEPVVEEPPRGDEEIDSELLEIFLGEAREVLAHIGESLRALRVAPTDQDSLTTIRRGFHTLKGSSRMVGLAAFGEAAWSLEQVLNLWLAEERAGTPALCALIEHSSARFERWVDALQAGDSPAIDLQPMIAAASALRDGLAHEAALAELARDACVEPLQPSELQNAGEVVHASAFAEPVASDPSGEASEARPESEAVEPVAFSADAVDAEAHDEFEAEEISVEAVPFEPEPFEPVSAVPVSERPIVPALPQTDAKPDELRIGERSISRSLYEVFLTEADQLIDVLASDGADWQLEPTRAASERAQRAMHSLKGSAALVELGEVHALAEQLETFLLRQRAAARPIDADDLAEYRHVVERMQAMLHQFAAGHAPRPEPDCFAVAHALAARWDPRVLASATTDSEHDLDADLLPIFVEEASDLLPRIGANLRGWLGSPADRSLQQGLMRDLHTVKGSARMAGAMALGQRVHEMETRIEAASVLSIVPLALIEELVADHDEVVAMFEAVREPRAHPATRIPLAAKQTQPQVAQAVPAEREAMPAQDASAPEPATAPARGQAPRATGEAAATAAAASALVRVRADLLERVVNESGEVAIARARLENELGTLRQSLQDLTENVTRLRTQLREIEIQAESQIQARIALQKDTSVEFDPLEFDRYTRFQELSRMLAESVNDVATVQQNAMRSLDGASQDMLRHTQVLRDLQQNLMRMRMVQFGTIADRLYRVVRQAAKELGKRVSMDMRGASVELDRGVLERMAGPIEHLLRNSVAHGIEPIDARRAAGKPEAGEIRVEVRQEGNEVVLIFADDGAGLDHAKILARGRALGLVASDAEPTPRELAELIFMPGFSTASQVTELAGRGIGTDVVRAEVHALGGRIDVDSEAGSGTRFTIHLPLTLAIAQVVLASVGESTYAIPSSSVEQVLQLKPQALAAAYDDGCVAWQGADVPLHYLGALVGLDDPRPVAQHLSPVMIVRSGNLRLAVHVDAVSRNQEVVVKNVGAQVARVQGIGGATVLGNGEIVLILNAARVAQAVLGDAWLERRGAAGARASLVDVPPTVMVVDDSLTVRKATQRLLVREGYDVMLAKDGIDALRQLQERQPEVMLVDIEMPRMDGFDLTRNVRADDRLRDTPVVMITSRMADKHRNHAMSLGVNVYLGKPYRDDELLAHVASLVDARRPKSKMRD